MFWTWLQCKIRRKSFAKYFRIFPFHIYTKARVYCLLTFSLRCIVSRDFTTWSDGITRTIETVTCMHTLFAFHARSIQFQSIVSEHMFHILYRLIEKPHWVYTYSLYDCHMFVWAGVLLGPKNLKQWHTAGWQCWCIAASTALHPTT